MKLFNFAIEVIIEYFNSSRRSKSDLSLSEGGAGDARGQRRGPAHGRGEAASGVRLRGHRRGGPGARGARIETNVGPDGIIQ